MSASDPMAEWCQGVEDVSREAAGAIHVAVIMRAEFSDLLGAALLGDREAEKLLQMVEQTLAHIAGAPRNRPMLCSCCPRSIKRGSAFNIAVAIPARDDPRGAIALAVCGRCATEPDGVMAKATEGLRRIWPDLRTVDITHPEGGRA